MSITPSSRAHRLAERATLAFTGIVKLAGLISACDQLLLKPHPESLPLLVSIFMLSGGQGLELLVLRLLGSLMGEARLSESHDSTPPH